MKIDIKMFKKLCTPLCKERKEKGLKPKIYNDTYFEKFNDYLKRNNFYSKINENNYKSYFFEFFDWYFGDKYGNRLDFDDSVKLNLLKRSGGCCSVCGVLTIFPLESDINKSLNIGAACHIHPASIYGPRANKKYRDENKQKINSIENGIWACLNCHKEIDSEPNKFTVEKLLDFKKKHESVILKIKNEKIKINDIIEKIYLEKDSNYIYIKNDIFESNQYLKNKLSKKSDKIEELYDELKNIEKESIKNLTFFNILKVLRDKKEENIGNGLLQLSISENQFHLKTEFNNDKDFYKLKEDFENTFDYDLKKSKIVKEDKIENILNGFINKKEKIQFFIINKEIKNVIEMDKTGFHVIKFKNENVLAIRKQNKAFIMELEKQKNGFLLNIKFPSDNDISIVLNEFIFIDYLYDFDFKDFYFSVIYEEEIYYYNFQIN